MDLNQLLSIYKFVSTVVCEADCRARPRMMNRLDLRGSRDESHTSNPPCAGLLGGPDESKSTSD
eukprot:132004-Hanusia_phi.AAC.1